MDRLRASKLPKEFAKPLSGGKSPAKQQGWKRARAKVALVSTSIARQDSDVMMGRRPDSKVGDSKGAKARQDWKRARGKVALATVSRQAYFSQNKRVKPDLKKVNWQSSLGAYQADRDYYYYKQVYNSKLRSATSDGERERLRLAWRAMKQDVTQSKRGLDARLLQVNRSSGLEGKARTEARLAQKRAFKAARGVADTDERRALRAKAKAGWKAAMKTTTNVGKQRNLMKQLQLTLRRIDAGSPASGTKFDEWKARNNERMQRQKKDMRMVNAAYTGTTDARAKLKTAYGKRVLDTGKVALPPHITRAKIKRSVAAYFDATQIATVGATSRSITKVLQAEFIGQFEKAVGTFMKSHAATVGKGLGIAAGMAGALLLPAGLTAIAAKWAITAGAASAASTKLRTGEVYGVPYSTFATGLRRYTVAVDAVNTATKKTRRVMEIVSDKLSQVFDGATLPMSDTFAKAYVSLVSRVDNWENGFLSIVQNFIEYQIRSRFKVSVNVGAIPGIITRHKPTVVKFLIGQDVSLKKLVVDLVDVVGDAELMRAEKLLVHTTLPEYKKQQIQRKLATKDARFERMKAMHKAPGRTGTPKTKKLPRSTSVLSAMNSAWLGGRR